jgi:hypothetical protein
LTGTTIGFLRNGGAWRIDMPQPRFFYHGTRVTGPRRCGAAAAEMLLVNDKLIN